MLRIASEVMSGRKVRAPGDGFPKALVPILAVLIGAPVLGGLSLSAHAEDDYSDYSIVSKDKPPPNPGTWPTCEEAKAGTELMVHVTGIKDDEGNLRVQLYDDVADHFLAKGWKLYRRDMPITGEDMDVCVPVPKPGVYALVVLHDANKNGKFDVFSEGFGFSNNPKIHFSTPDHEDVAFQINPGINNVEVDMNYVFAGRKKRVRRGGKF